MTLKSGIASSILSLVLLPFAAFAQSQEEGVITFSSEDGVVEIVSETQRGAVVEVSCKVGPRVALTFDDGPRRGHTSEVLDILWSKGAVATFFVLGQQVSANPTLVHRILEEGHEIGLHSHSHPDMSKLTLLAQELETTRAWNALLDIVPDYSPVFWRAPYGSLSGVDMAFPKSLGMTHMGWSVDSFDWKNPSSELFLENILPRVRDGSVILMHEHTPATRQNLAVLIDHLAEMGASFRTVSTLKDPVCI